MSIAADGERPLPAATTDHSGMVPARWAAPLDDRWRRVEYLLALGGAVVIAMRFSLPHLLTLGDVLAFVTVPLWLSSMWRNMGARTILLLGLAAVPVGAMLSWLSADDHIVRLGSMADASILVLGLLASLGFLKWASERLPEGTLVFAFGLGLLLGVSDSNPLYSTNPYKYGFALPLAVIVLGLLHRSSSRRLELVAVALLALASALTDARSSFAILALTATLLAWQRRPLARTPRASAARAVLGMTLGAAITYAIAQNLILNGLLGPETQARSLEQVDRSGLLILGGRPEIAATGALMWEHPLGFGSGTVPNFADVATAKAGMSEIGYDPRNGYVERWMFGYNYRLHSMFGDLWAQFGVVGLALAVVIFLLVLRKLSEVITSRTASAAFCFLAVLTLWNVFFAPWYSSMRSLALTLALVLITRPSTNSSPEIEKSGPG